jgi:hypothetical protein
MKPMHDYFRPRMQRAQLSDHRCVQHRVFRRRFLEKRQIDKNRVRCSASRFVLDPLLHQSQTFGGLMNIVSVRNIAKSLEDLLKAFCPRRSKGLPSHRENTIVVNWWTQTQDPTATQCIPQASRHNRAAYRRRRAAARPVGSVLLSYKCQRGVTIERW